MYSFSKNLDIKYSKTTLNIREVYSVGSKDTSDHHTLKVIVRYASHHSAAAMEICWITDSSYISGEAT